MNSTIEEMMVWSLKLTQVTANLMHCVCTNCWRNTSPCLTGTRIRCYKNSKVEFAFQYEFQRGQSFIHEDIILEILEDEERPRKKSLTCFLSFDEPKLMFDAKN